MSLPPSVETNDKKAKAPTKKTKKPPVKKVVPTAVKMSSLEIPFAEESSALQFCTSLSVKTLTSKQRKGMFRFVAGMVASDATMDDGCKVQNRQAAFKWLLERFADLSEEN